MRLHDHAASGNCYKARLLLSLLAIPYERVEVDIFAGDTLTDEYAALNPVRETPVLELDDGTHDRPVQRDPRLPRARDRLPPRATGSSRRRSTSGSRSSRSG